MLNTIKRFFEDNISADKPADLEHRLKLATAALLIEMMLQDGELHESELRAVKAALSKKFKLNTEAADALYELAHTEARKSTDYYQFTSLINQHFSPQQKIKVVEYLWEIAYADGELDRYEEHMVRRISELIYVSHSDFIKAKHRVAGV